MRYVIRYVASKDEIRDVIDTMEPWFVPPMQDASFTLDRLLAHFPEFRAMMVIAEDSGALAGGALGYGGTMAIIAVRPDVRMRGLGRRLLQTLEIGAMHHGVTMISLGARTEAKGFYERIGYSGKSSMHKGLPLPGKSLSWRLRKLDAAMGDLVTGQDVQPDADGSIPPLQTW